MLRSLFLLVVYCAFLGGGMAAPFVLTLGYVWVDTFQPQLIAYIILNSFPVAMIMGGGAMLAYIALDRRAAPRMNLPWALQIAMAIWVTVTMLWAEAPAAGWDKWNWAFKTILFSAFIPLSIRSRIQIEAFAQVYVLSLAANFMTFGIKTLISGGGYGVNLGLVSGNGGLAEGGLLSTLCLMAVPLTLFLARHGLLNPRVRFISLAYWLMAGLATATALGTFERSALIGLLVMAAYALLRSRHKIRLGILLVVLALVGSYATSDKWTERISTIQDYHEESSANTRLLIWRWTFNYALSHPLGGAFNSYVINRIELPDGSFELGRAFHSIYFEMLGEEGWPGLAMFLLLSGNTILGLARVSRRTRDVPHLAWCAAMSDALQASMVVFMSSGAFVGLAFQPMYWYTIALSVSLRQYVKRCESAPAAARAPMGWRGTGVPARST